MPTLSVASLAPVSRLSARAAWLLGKPASILIVGSKVPLDRKLGDMTPLVMLMYVVRIAPSLSTTSRRKKHQCIKKETGYCLAIAALSFPSESEYGDLGSFRSSPVKRWFARRVIFSLCPVQQRNFHGIHVIRRVQHPGL